MAKLKKQEFYTSDSGKTVEIKEMASSHLMNAIMHHNRQIELLEQLRPNATRHHENLSTRRARLVEVVARLSEELASREYDEKEVECSPESYSRLGGRL